MCIITHAVWITLSVQDNTLHTLCDITQRVSNYYTLYSKRPIFRVQSGKKLHRAEKIYTDTACGVCDKYEVCGVVHLTMAYIVRYSFYMACIARYSANILTASFDLIAIMAGSHTGREIISKHWNTERFLFKRYFPVFKNILHIVHTGVKKFSKKYTKIYTGTW